MTESIDAVILAAGMGTRMKSRKPKVLHSAGGLTLVEHVVETARTVTSPDRIVVVVGHGADEVKSQLAPSGVAFALQAEQKGTGHAMLCCRDHLERRSTGERPLLAVLYGDTPLLSPKTLRGLIDAQRNSDAAATVLTTRLPNPSGYGRIVRDQRGRVAAIVEHKAATPEQLLIDEINSGIYCFRADLLWKHIGEIGTNNPAREYYLTDIVDIFNRAGHHVEPLVLEDSTEVLGINTRVELAEADRVFRERKTREVMLAGVTLEKPETVTIDKHVRIGPDTIVGAYAQLLGNTEIGSDCLVGSGSIIRDSTIGDRVEIGPYTLIGTSRVGEGAHIGPFARLRLDNDVEAGAHIGNFVELKKTRMRSGAKANHLAYLGDSEIGEKVNVGAGTITCNYDGVNKHRTVIGEGAFIGSNSTLVAPLEVAPGSYVGAGSVITDPVPADSLALGRGRQVVKEGWAKKRREQTEASRTAKS